MQQIDQEAAVQVEWLRILGFFLGTVAVVMVFHELGYRLGLGAHRRSADEKEAAISGAWPISNPPRIGR